MAFVDQYGPWALITGASSGIGAEFARQIASRGVNVALVARRKERLDALAEDIEQRDQVRTLTIAVDLTDSAFLEHITEALGTRHIGLLINNAGAGKTGPFLDRDLDEALQTLDLNCRAPLTLAHHFGRRMRDDRRGGIVMLASVAGIVPIPYFSNYSATKAWNRFLGEGLHTELAGDGVDVLTVCPGVTQSEFLDQVGVDTADWPAALRMTVTSPEAVVKSALKSLGRQTRVVPGLSNRMVVQLQRLAPKSWPPRIAAQFMRLANKSD